jgi:hypothetical protein
MRALPANGLPEKWVFIPACRFLHHIRRLYLLPRRPPTPRRFQLSLQRLTQQDPLPPPLLLSPLHTRRASPLCLPLVSQLRSLPLSLQDSQPSRPRVTQRPLRQQLRQPTQRVLPQQAQRLTLRLHVSQGITALAYPAPRVVPASSLARTMLLHAPRVPTESSPPGLAPSAARALSANSTSRPVLHARTA